MNLANLPPLGQKAPKQPDDPEHLEKVRSLPCCICSAWGLPQTTPTEAHHCIHGRHSQQRRPDRQAIPLCTDHHRGRAGVFSVHGTPAAFRTLFGDDTDWIAPTLDKIEAMK